LLSLINIRRLQGRGCMSYMASEYIARRERGGCFHAFHSPFRSPVASPCSDIYHASRGPPSLVEVKARFGLIFDQITSARLQLRLTGRTYWAPIHPSGYNPHSTMWSSLEKVQWIEYTNNNSSSSPIS